MSKENEFNEYRIFRDGYSWCAVNNEFINIQESDVGFGDNPLEALTELYKTQHEDKNAMKLFTLDTKYPVIRKELET